HAETLGGEGLAGAPEATDHLVEDEQDTVLVANLAQALEIAFGWNQNPSRPRDGLDNAGRDRAGTVEIDEALQILGELGAPGRLAGCVTVFREPGVAHMGNPRHDRAEGLPVAHHPGEGEATD